MGIFFVYILKSSVCLAAFYLFYRLLLSRDTFHRFNRFALLGILVLSCLLPLIEVSIHQETEVHQAVMTLEEWLLLADAINSADAQVQTLKIAWIQVTLLLYMGGILFFAFRHIYSLFRLVMLLKSGRRENLDNYVRGQNREILVVHHRAIAPFSWMKYIAISQKDLEENGREILIHELAHIHNFHSWDLLVADICLFFQWFNPAAWLLKQELQNIHEYEADETVIQEGVDAKQYQLLLIKKAVGTRLYSMANSFNHSKLKKRITMMLKEKSSPWARLKYLYVLPVAAIAVTAFARPEVSNTMEEISTAKVNELAVITETKVAENVPQVSVTPAIRVMSPNDVKSAKKEEDPPLILINGKEANSAIMGALNPNSIESISVLKDKSATVVYGEKGKNGVILVTLKKERSAITVTGYRKDDTSTADAQKRSTLDEAKGLEDCVLIVDGELVDMAGRKIDEIVPTDKIESVSVNRSSTGKGEIHIITKKNAKGAE